MCGEHWGGNAPIHIPWGSSPHVRGTPRVDPRRTVWYGIIPACAGNTTPTIVPTSPAWDHPRMCGEHPSCNGSATRWAGSSPHVRGTLAQVVGDLDGLGIIPACAGNTSSQPCVSRSARDHPRMCGEHVTNLATTGVQGGSSPHVRGTRDVERHGREATGIIPACAGNTRTANRSNCPPWDHPRMCGEHILPPLVCVSISGSSPHVRGTPKPSTSQAEDTGIIPACAGNTRCHRDNSR